MEIPDGTKIKNYLDYIYMFESFCLVSRPTQFAMPPAIKMEGIREVHKWLSDLAEPKGS